MGKVVPVSDETQGSQVLLTNNDIAKHAVADYGEDQRAKATIRLLEELKIGYQSLRTEKNYTPHEFKKSLEEDLG